VPITALRELFSGDEARAEAALDQVDAACIPALEMALNARRPDDRWWAARALSKLAGLPEPRAVAALLSVAADPDENLRAAVLHGLGEARVAEAVSPLLQALQSPSPYLNRVAADALIRIGPAAVPGLIEALKQAGESRVRSSAARALALIGDKSAIPALFYALSDESALVQYWAEEGLERMGAGQVYFKP
jgi:HEAT repeat protein